MKDPVIIILVASATICGVLTLAAYAAASYRDAVRQKQEPPVAPPRPIQIANYQDTQKESVRRENIDAPTYTRQQDPFVSTAPNAVELEPMPSKRI